MTTPARETPAHATPAPSAHPAPAPAGRGTPIAQLIDTGREWFSTLRWKALAYLLGIALATAATILVTGMAWVPIVGVAVAAAAVSLNKVASRLSSPVCWTCGHDLRDQPRTPMGIVCPACGGIHQPLPGSSNDEALLAEVDSPGDDELADALPAGNTDEPGPTAQA